MLTPPFLIGAAFLFWGQQTGYWLFAIPMALVLEGTRLVQRRWDMSPKDFYRVSDLCALIFLGMFIIRFALKTPSMGRWIPLGLFPLLLAQALSTTQRIDLGAFFYTKRKREKAGGFRERRTADVSWPTFVLVLVAASSANVRTPVFYAGMFLLTGWALASFRPKRFHPVFWVILLLAAGGLGFAGQHHLRRLHLFIEQTALDWYMERMGLDRNPFRNVTSIGDVGELKLSNRIVWRVRPEGDLPASHLLRDASYNLYSSGFWIATDAKFKTILPDEGGMAWWITDNVERRLPLHITGHMNEESSILSLPLGTGYIDHLPAGLLEKNRFGTVRVKAGPKLARYRVYFEERSAGGAPDQRDLELPGKEAEAVRSIARELQLSGRSSAEVVTVLEAFFQNSFQYSLALQAHRKDLTPVEDFLLHSRSGHCEFFATAGVFLLRAAGVPARYVTGYRVDEFSRLEGQYVVRARHAHAWATAFIDGRWQDVDFTPPGWLTREKEAAPWLEPVYDFFRWVGFQFSKWRSGREGGPPLYLLWLVLPLFMVLVWRILSEKRASRLKKKKTPGVDRLLRSGVNSPLESIDNVLARHGFQRREWETQQARLHRLEAAGADAEAAARLNIILNLHYQVRFRPDEPPDTTEELKRAVDSWITVYGSGDQLFPAEQEASQDRAR